jgi:hypothetical protein
MSAKGANPERNVQTLQTPSVEPAFLIKPWPFLFCQKPIVCARRSPPGRKTVTASSSVMAEPPSGVTDATLGYDTQPEATLIVFE